MESKDSSAADRQNVSFKFTKKVSKALSGNKLDDASTKNTEKDFIISVDKREIKSSAPKAKEKDLVIPLIKKNNWRVADAEDIQSNDPDRKLKEMAIQELIKESKETQREKEESVNNIDIPLIMQNKIPEGFETDEKMDVSLRPEESTLEDYERIPIEKFGLAVLKGMGWKEGDPVGNNATKASVPVQVQLRPKGLGLGADTSALNKAKEKKKVDGEKLQLIKGAYVQVIQGSNKGFYGEVLGLDEENARVIVKLSGKDKTSTFPEFSVDVVSKKEFEKESKVINRASYEKYKREHENGESEHRSREKSREKQDTSREREKSSKEKKRSHEEKSTEKKESHKKTKHSEKSSSSRGSSRTGDSKPWVRPQLRVRLIDDEYKKGRYFNEKLVVVDVLSPKSCTCRTENDRYLEDISPSMLETVIPRSENSYVMIVQGKHSGELCSILQKDKSKCLATVQFLSDRGQALQIEYDSICEYVGDVADFD